MICGGVDLHLTTNGGRTWSRITHWDHDRGTRHYAHADHHGLLMPAGAPGRVYDPNDGGFDVSEDGGRTWSNRSNGLAATMHYDLDVAQSDARVFGGGSQDNGTLITVTGRPDDHSEILGGDGGWILFDPTDAAHLFAWYYNLNIFRFRGHRHADVSPRAGDDEKNSTWMAFLAMIPATPIPSSRDPAASGARATTARRGRPSPRRSTARRFRRSRSPAATAPASTWGRRTEASTAAWTAGRPGAPTSPGRGCPATPSRGWPRHPTAWTARSRRSPTSGTRTSSDRTTAH